MPRSQGTSRKGKPKKMERASGMGNALLRATKTQFKPKDNGSSRGAGMVSSGAGDLGVDKEVIKQRTGMLSKLEADSLEDFISKAEMEDREFASTKERFVVIDERGELDKSNMQQYGADGIGQSTRDVGGFDRFDSEGLKVPRRPKWDESTTAEELDRTERESFLDWRRNLAALQESKDTSQITPFEKNLNVWKQLWRVTERCAIVLQIVDARNPIFYLSADLRVMVEEEMGKKMIIVINKSDYLTSKQRRMWGAYFAKENIECVFFSAWEEQRKVDERYRAQNAAEEAGEDKEEENSPMPPPPPQERVNDASGAEHLLSREELLAYLKMTAAKYNIAPSERFNNTVQYGTVGFPNVGKSSLINVLLGSATSQHGVNRVGVASQPGKTKHFQTLLVPGEDDMMLCDCPGLVFPSFVSSTADMIAAGVYPIAQMRNHWPVVGLICQRIAREVLNGTYGFKLPIVIPEGHNPNALPPPPTAEELLTEYCRARSIIAAGSGVPDWQRASRVVVKDYVEGKLLFNHPPPELERKEEKGYIIDTQMTAMGNTARLKDRWEELQNSENKDKAPTSPNASSTPNPVSPGEGFDSDEEIDLDILDFMNGGNAEEDVITGGKRGKAHKKMHKWGKKGRKQRNKDPYGCHDDGLNEILDSGDGISGLNVQQSKKNSRKGYTRPTHNPKGAELVPSSHKKVNV
ncbi:hypothetical protein TrLO_g1752 [Triparma laevis f. longispina]|uniref:G domain-containing protein n=1 Tax=Triparma laevis f. longispina TaxID=1714387 RepID=A0A9W7BZC8_9STRA|nr:hypothetical protein TrLO_g1752 [Triparma laevis f. longispina]